MGRRKRRGGKTGRGNLESFEPRRFASFMYLGKCLVDQKGVTVLNVRAPLSKNGLAVFNSGKEIRKRNIPSRPHEPYRECHDGGGSDPRSWLGSFRWERHPSSRHVCCGMAFPIPPHLPKKQPANVSSAILNRISDADSKSLNAALAKSWITDLDDSIRAAKVSLCLSFRST